MICQIDRAEESSDPRMIGVLISRHLLNPAQAGLYGITTHAEASCCGSKDPSSLQKLCAGAQRSRATRSTQVERALRARYRHVDLETVICQSVPMHFPI